MNALRVVIDRWTGAFPLEHVREVVRAVAVTPLGGGPSAVLGFINVRGDLVPVVDTRERLHLAQRELRTSDRMVLVACRDGTVAVPVDAALDVVSLERDPVPPPGSTLPTVAGPASSVGRRRRTAHQARGLRPARLAGSDTEVVILSDPEVLFGDIAATVRVAGPGWAGTTPVVSRSPD